MTYSYSGKPKGALHLEEGKWIRLDIPALKPAGLALHCLYVHLDYTLPGPIVGRVRPRLVRGPWKGEGRDETAYDDIWLHAGYDDTLATKLYFELAQTGRPTWWELKAENADVVIQTRYDKSAFNIVHR